MTVYLISLMLFMLTFSALALKMMFGRPGIKGSCGGHQGLEQKLSCTGCACEKENGSSGVKAVTLLR